MANNKKQYGDFLGEVSMMRWSEFIKAELDMDISTSDSIVLSLVRACAMESIPAIKTAIDRLDGRPETPIEIILPKVFYLYPNAETQPDTVIVEDDEQYSVEPPEQLESGPTEVIIENEVEVVRGFRETIRKMQGYPRSVPMTIIDQQNQVEEFMRRSGPRPVRDPRVQSVVAAKLLKMAQEGKIDAFNDIVDRMDGKTVDKFKVVGEDMYIMKFGSVAPVGAIKNEQGVYQVEATESQKMWRQKLTK